MVLRHIAGKRIRLFCAVSLAVFSLGDVASAQQPIRVETNQVLVPVFVGDKRRVRLLKRDPTECFHAVLAGDTKATDAIEQSLVIRNLTATDFQVLDDGKVQPIRSVTYQSSLYWDVRDNQGHHTEYFGPGGGKWSTAEWPPGLVGDVDLPYYLVAYPLPDSPNGSCHQIKVRVNRRNALVAARSEYCNTVHLASDPANGTKLGEELESALTSTNEGKVHVSLMAVTLNSNKTFPFVHFALDWPPTALRAESNKAVLGMVLNKKGELVTRFSDLADRMGIPNREMAWLGDRYEIALAEDRFETQLTLPAGEYDVRVAVTDGTKFGRAEIHTTVDTYDKRALAISALSLCHQILDMSAYASGHASALPGAWTTKLPESYVPLISNDIEYKPTANTHFKKGETLYTYFEVYEPSLAAAESQVTVEIEMRIVDARTGTSLSAPEAISAAKYIKSGDPVIRIGRGIDISKLPSGSYQLQLRATDSVGRTTPWKNADFDIE